LGLIKQGLASDAFSVQACLPSCRASAFTFFIVRVFYIKAFKSASQFFPQKSKQKTLDYALCYEK
jgi:hypothetical protein